MSDLIWFIIVVGGACLVNGYSGVQRRIFSSLGPTGQQIVQSKNYQPSQNTVYSAPTPALSPANLPQPYLLKDSSLSNKDLIRQQDALKMAVKESITHPIFDAGLYPNNQNIFSNATINKR